MGTDLSQGLKSRFEALPKFGKSPKSPRGVMAKAITPPAQRTTLSTPSGFLFWNIYILIFCLMVVFRTQYKLKCIK